MQRNLNAQTDIDSDLTVARWVLGPLYWYAWPVLRSKVEEARRRSKESKKAQSRLSVPKSEAKIDRTVNSKDTGEINDDEAVAQTVCHT